MKKRFMFPVVAVIAALAMTVGANAFMGKETEIKNDTRFANTYFTYSGASETAADLRTAANWTELPSYPSGASCNGGTIVCVSHLDNTILASRPGATNRDKFVNYLSQPSVNPVAFVNANSDQEKP